MSHQNECYTDIKESCNVCKNKNCTLKRVLCDANTISSAFLEEKQSGIAKDFLDNHRKKYKVLVTNEILGEALFTIVKRSQNESLLNTNTANFVGYLKTFIVKDSLYDAVKFREILNKLLDNNYLRCRHTDRLHIANAIYLNIDFFTFDEKIGEDENTINELFKEEGYKLKLFKIKSK